jgi:hypothetical protein
MPAERATRSNSSTVVLSPDPSAERQTASVLRSSLIDATLRRLRMNREGVASPSCAVLKFIDYDNRIPDAEPVGNDLVPQK